MRGCQTYHCWGAPQATEPHHKQTTQPSFPATSFSHRMKIPYYSCPAQSTLAECQYELLYSSCCRAIWAWALASWQRKSSSLAIRALGSALHWLLYIISLCLSEMVLPSGSRALVSPFHLPGHFLDAGRTGEAFSPWDPHSGRRATWKTRDTQC